jgi:CBS domain-containing protein
MTTKIVSVHPETPVRDVARALFTNRVSAVPVIDLNEVPIGIISEGDLVTRSQTDREERRDWWLSLLAEGEHLNEDFLSYTRADRRVAHQIMNAPVVTVSEDTALSEVARVLTEYRIKRVPVLREGRIVGIVSRADLVRAMTGSGANSAGHVPFASAESALPPVRPPAAPLPAAGLGGFSVNIFHELMADYEHAEAQRKAALRLAEANRRRALAKDLIDHHIEDDSWRAMLHDARQAAEHGDKEYMIFRFPSELCSDGGRAINAPEPIWPETLRGEAAEIYLRWERDLKPAGFHLSARVLEFPGGMPGDIGMFLVWGTE